jgi:hypothetical protein
MVDILLVNWKESWCNLWVEVREDTDSARVIKAEAVRFMSARAMSFAALRSRRRLRDPILKFENCKSIY